MLSFSGSCHWLILQLLTAIHYRNSAATENCPQLHSDIHRALCCDCFTATVTVLLINYHKPSQFVFKKWQEIICVHWNDHTHTHTHTHTQKNNSFLTIVQHHITSRCENEATDSLVPMINGRGSCIAILTTAIQLSDSQWPLTVLAIAICPLGTVYIICSTVHFHQEPKKYMVWC